MKIGLKLILGFLVVASLIAVVGGIAAIQQTNIINDYAILDAKDVAIAIEESISVELVMVPMYLTPDLQKILMDHIEYGEDFVVVDANKMVLADAIPENIGTKFTHDAGNEIGLAISSGVAKSFKEISKDYPEGIDLVAVPMKSDGKTVGAVLIEYHAGEFEEAKAVAESFAVSITHKPKSIPLINEKEKLQNYVEELSDTIGRDIVVIDKNKIVLADTVPENIGKEFTHDEGDEIRLTMDDRKTRTFKEISPDYPEGVPLIVIPMVLKEKGEKETEGEVIGAVITSYPLFEESFRNIWIVILVTSLVTIVLAIGLGVFISRSISKPMTKLRDAANEIAKGNFDVEIGVTSNDEIGELASRFDKMRQSVKSVMKAYEKREKGER